MGPTAPLDGGNRQQLIDELLAAGREQSYAVVMYHTAVAAVMGLGPTDEKTLDLVVRFGPIGAGEISAQTGLAPASVTGVLKRLELKGYVRRLADPNDARRVLVEVNSEPLARTARLWDELVGSMKDLFQAYDDQQLELIRDFIREAARRQRAAIPGLVRMKQASKA